MLDVKRRVQTKLERMGYVVSRRKPSPFPEIESVPRYVKKKVQLLGNDFIVADAASFLASYREIFVEEIYRFDTTKADPRIVDCGANYGVSVLYFKHLYPQARISAVEADPAIFEILQNNLVASGMVDVTLVNKAVSNNAESLRFHSEGADGGRAHGLGSALSVQVIPAVMLDELIDGPVDFLKMDIEGAECAALAACTRLDQVDQMFIEYHSFTDAPQALGELLSLLRERGFRYYIHTQFCSKTPLTIEQSHMGMDLQLNIFVKRPRKVVAH